MTSKQRDTLMFLGDLFAAIYKQEVAKITIQNCGQGYLLITRVTFAAKPAA